MTGGLGQRQPDHTPCVVAEDACLRAFATRDCSGVAIRHSLAPESTYPAPVRQAMTALEHVQVHADRLHDERSPTWAHFPGGTTIWIVLVSRTAAAPPLKRTSTTTVARP